ncbi:MAG: amidohydrolase family protein [Planctomycetes bacterium]|nr:amidohydrolase family protein [Planctomycetota bacterium]
MTESNKLLITNAKVVTMDAENRILDNHDILIENDTIVAVGTGLATSETAAGAVVRDATGLMAIPGLINGHYHSPGNFMRGAIEDYPLEVFMLYEVPPLSDKPLSPRLNYVRTMLSSLEMLRNGTTAVFDDAFYVPVPNEESIDGIMNYYVDCGIRAAVTLDQPLLVEYDKYPYLREILPPERRQDMEAAPRLSPEAMLDLYASFIARWKGTDGGRVSPAVSCSAPQRVPAEYFTALAGLSEQHDIPYAVHILETKLQRVLGREKFGKSLIQYVDDLGCINPRMEIIHSIWVDESDMGAMARGGCTVSHQPLCNLRIGSGIMPFRRMRSHGIHICLGTDEACTDDAVNMWNVAKMAGLVHKITNPDYRDWPTALEIFRCLVHGGARVLLKPDKLGVIAPGRLADLALVDLNTLSFTPLNDVYRQMVFSENGSSVRATIVAGRIVYDDGKILTVDEEAIKAEARELAREYTATLAQSDAAAGVLEPYYREMYLRCAKEDVGMNRWAGPEFP